MPENRKEPVKRDTTVADRSCLICDGPVEHSSGKFNGMCDTCAYPIARFITAAFCQKGNLDEADATLSHIQKRSQSPVWQYYLGLVQAEAGNIDDGITLLQELLNSDLEKGELHGSLTTMLAVRALSQVKEQKYETAINDLSLAAGLEPQNEDIVRSLNLAKGISALTGTGKSTGIQGLSRTINVLKDLQLQQPADFSTAHNLAILSYRLASEAEENGKESIADKAWKDAISNWALLIYNDGFWREWIARENSLYQIGVTTKEAQRLSRSLEARLLQDFRTYRADYYKADKPDAAARHREYEILFKLEAKTVRAAKRIQDELRKYKVHFALPVACGPLMLQNLNLTDSARELISQASLHNLAGDAVEKLRKCLSPHGRIAVLIEMPLLDQAETELDSLLSQEPHDKELKGFMANVLLSLGRHMVSSGQWEQGIDKLEKCLRYAEGDRKCEKALVSACVDGAKQLSEGESKSEIDKAIKILERGINSLPNNRELKEWLARSYAQRGIINANNEKYKAALQDMESALQYDRNNALVKESIQTIAGNWAVELANAGAINEAIKLATRYLEYGENLDYRKLLSQLHLNRAVERFNTGDRYGGTDDIQKAFEYDPNNEDIKKILKQLSDRGIY